ncbi:MAG: tetratricopeptide repeat protein [Lachnospiraceae bacterium]|nr:tetratricopeptide repeat protein [Lachnospiraceae bacterium]
MRRVKRFLIFSGILGFACMVTACAKQVDNTNILKGMEAIEALDYNGALEAFDTAELYEEDLQLIYRGEGIANMGLGNYQEAVDCFLMSIKEADGQVTGLEFDTNYYLASAYYKLNNYEAAKEIYDAILGLDAKSVDAYFLRGCCYLQQGDFDSALADFEQAFSLEPENIDLVADAFIELQAAGYEAEGLEYVKEFMSKENKRLTDSEKGTLYYYLGDYENARIYLDGALTSGDAEVSLILGQTYEKLGDRNYAVVVYSTYLESNPANAAIYNSLGVCLMQQEKYEEALAAFEAGITLNDVAQQQTLWFNRIVANEYLGNFAQAKSFMQEYLKYYPDDAKALREWDFLCTR